MKPTKQDLLYYVGYAVDDALNGRAIASTKDLDHIDLDYAAIVTIQCGFEPMAVLVYSCLPKTRIDQDEALVLAEDYLTEIGWTESFDDKDVSVYIH